MSLKSAASKFKILDFPVSYINTKWNILNFIEPKV
jgi:hypothetical protein